MKKLINVVVVAVISMFTCNVTPAQAQVKNPGKASVDRQLSKLLDLEAKALKIRDEAQAAVTKLESDPKLGKLEPAVQAAKKKLDENLELKEIFEQKKLATARTALGLLEDQLESIIDAQQVARANAGTAAGEIRIGELKEEKAGKDKEIQEAQDNVTSEEDKFIVTQTDLERKYRRQLKLNSGTILDCLNAEITVDTNNLNKAANAFAGTNFADPLTPVSGSHAEKLGKLRTDLEKAEKALDAATEQVRIYSEAHAAINGPSTSTVYSPVIPAPTPITPAVTAATIVVNADLTELRTKVENHGKAIETLVANDKLQDQAILDQAELIKKMNLMAATMIKCANQEEADALSLLLARQLKAGGDPVKTLDSLKSKLEQLQREIDADKASIRYDIACNNAGHLVLVHKTK